MHLENGKKRPHVYVVEYGGLAGSFTRCNALSFSPLSFSLDLLLLTSLFLYFLLGESCWSSFQQVTKRGQIVMTSPGNEDEMKSFPRFSYLYFSSLSGIGGISWNCNYDHYRNSPYSLNIASHNQHGLPSSSSPLCAAVVYSPLSLSLSLSLLFSPLPLLSLLVS